MSCFIWRYSLFAKANINNKLAHMQTNVFEMLHVVRYRCRHVHVHYIIVWTSLEWFPFSNNKMVGKWSVNEARGFAVLKNFQQTEILQWDKMTENTDD